MHIDTIGLQSKTPNIPSVKTPDKSKFNQFLQNNETAIYNNADRLYSRGIHDGYNTGYFDALYGKPYNEVGSNQGDNIYTHGHMLGYKIGRQTHQNGYQYHEMNYSQSTHLSKYYPTPTYKDIFINLNHGGFMLDTSSILSIFPDAQAKKIIQSFKDSLDMVNSLPLPENIMQVIKNIPIKLSTMAPTGVTSLYFYAPHNESGPWILSQMTYPLPSGSLSFLHELMHGLHTSLTYSDPARYDKLKEYYQEAKSRAPYPAKNYYMFVDEYEFVAESFTYILMNTDRNNPLNREVIKKAQPKYFYFVLDTLGISENQLPPMRN